MEHKALPFQVSEIKETPGGAWEVAGYASTWGGEPDSYGDIVARGAFVDSLAKRKTRLLWQHDMGEPIGKQISLEEDDKGLFGRWSIVPTDVGTKAHQLLVAELVDSLSIGFMTVEAEYREDGVRVLKKADLYEVSLVTIPANANAMVSSFKSDLPIHLLLKQATENVTQTVAQAKAYRERRTSEGRAVTDRYSAALDEFLAAVEAAEELTAPVVVVPEAKADASQGVALRLELARRRYAEQIRETA